MQRSVAAVGAGQGFDAEKACAGGTALQFLVSGFAHAFDAQADANRNAGQRVVGVQHHVLRVDIGDGEQCVFGRVRVAASGQGGTFERQSHLQFCRK